MQSLVGALAVSRSRRSEDLFSRVGDVGASPAQAQRFCSAHAMICPHFQPGRHLMSAPEWRETMTDRFTIWKEITGVTPAA